MRREFLGGQELLHLRRGNRHDLRPDVAGRLPGAAGDVAIAADHPLIGAVGGVFGRLEKRVGAQPLADAVEFVVELQARGQRLRAVAQLAANFS